MPTGQDRLVVPLDGSPAGEAALPYAALVGMAYGLDVELVHVVDEEPSSSAEVAGPAREWFETYAKEAASRHGLASFTANVVVGSPASAILDHAEGARFIAIASHGRGGIRAALIGSVADKVVRGAEVPVVFVPCEGTPASAASDTVLIALDGSGRCLLGLAAGRELASRLSAKVALVRCWHYMTQYSGEIPYQSAEMLDAPKDEAEGYLAEIAGGDEKKFAINGYPPVAIAQVADQVDARFIVVTASGKGVGKRLVLGSTTNRLMHSSKRPLLIVPVTS